MTLLHEWILQCVAPQLPRHGQFWRLPANPPRELSARTARRRYRSSTGFPGWPAKPSRTPRASAVSGTVTTWPGTEEDEATFLVKTGVSPRDLAGQLVLDAGCGGGRYARLLGSHGARVIAADLSSAVAKAAELCASLPNVLVLQADLLDLPLARRSL